MIDTTDRHPSVRDIVRLLDSQHLPHDALGNVSRIFENAASHLLAALPDGPRLTSALEGLWKAKNDAVGHAVIALLDPEKGAPDVTLQPGETHGV